ncbi:hypothetical protein JTE90_025448 [Oedothorax gibbosus]|uniref:C2H2-type domain-containing protein n=1 Tax=Oedothorax gibbosus TaxID=931172 RepID=A0AAV6U991_9ARAC|nr:hypothetical protein JTE90_025448 [Oedothorax gibbosus]
MDHTDKGNIFTDDDSDSDGSLSLNVGLNCEICEKTFNSFKSFLQHEKSSNHYKKISQKKLKKKLSKNLDDELSISIDDMTLYPKAFTECDACRKEFSGPESYYQHLKSKAHRKKVERAKLLEQVTVEGKVDMEKLAEVLRPNKDTLTEVGASGYSPTVEDTGSEDDGQGEIHQFECTDCVKVFTGIDPWYQHLVSKTHEKTLKQKRLRVQVTGAQTKYPEHSETASLPSEYLDPIEVDGDVLICRLCHMSFSGPESAAAHLKSKGHAKKKELRKFKIEMATKKSHIEKKKALDFKNENQAPKGPATTTRDFKQSNSAITNKIAEDASVKGLDNPTQEGDSELKKKSHIKKTKAQDLGNENQMSSRQASDVEESELVSPTELGKDIATDKEATGVSGHSDRKENSSEDLENSVNVIASKDAVVETENLINTRRDDVLLCYEKYKNYKKMMNEIEAEEKH